MRRLIIMCAVSVFCLVASAISGEAPLRMTSESAAGFLADVSEITRAVHEREYAVSTATSLVFNAVSGSPGSVMTNLAARILNVSRSYVDTSMARDGTYNQWFARDTTNRSVVVPFNLPPVWTETNLVYQSGLPANGLRSIPPSAMAMMTGTNWTVERFKDCIGLLSLYPLNIEYQRNICDITYASEARGSDSTYEAGDAPATAMPSGGICPPLNPVTTVEVTTGQAIWEKQHDVHYRRTVTERKDDYMCVDPYFNNAIEVSEQHSAFSLHRIVRDIRIQPRFRKPGLSGTAYAYGCFIYATNAAVLQTKVAYTGCVRFESDGATKIEMVLATNTYTIPAWDPGLPRHYAFDSTLDVDLGRADNALSIAPPADPLAGLQPVAVPSDNYTCDRSFGPDYFGLWCYGTWGYVETVQSCVETLPRRTISYDIGHVFMEANFVYCP